MNEYAPFGGLLNSNIQLNIEDRNEGDEEKEESFLNQFNQLIYSQKGFKEEENPEGVDLIKLNQDEEVKNEYCGVFLKNNSSINLDCAEGSYIYKKE